MSIVGAIQVLDRKSARCARCRGLIKRGDMCRPSDDGGVVHPRCAGSGAVSALEIIGALSAGDRTPLCQAEICRATKLKHTVVTRRCAELVTLGILKRAGDYYRFNREITIPEAIRRLERQ